MNRNIGIFLPLFLLFPIPSYTEELRLTYWSPQWTFDPMDDSVSCNMFSRPINFKGKFGVNKLYIGVQEDNRISLHTDKSTFDSRYISKFGIRVGNNAAVFGPEYKSTNLTVFSTVKSKILTDQLMTTYDFTVQVAFFPDDQIVNKKLHTGVDTKSFQSVLMSKNYCSVIKESDGWVGVYITDLMAAKQHIDFVKKHTKFDNPGVVIWSLHPKKQGSESGLETFDVILGVNSKPITSQTFIETIKALKSGETITLNILRGKRAKNIKLTRPFASSATNPNWENICPKPDVSYCNGVNKNAHNNSTNPQLLRGIKLGKITGVTWRPKGSVISISAGIPEAGIPESVRKSPRDAYYYIIDDGSGKPFVRQCREIDAK